MSNSLEQDTRTDVVQTGYFGETKDSSSNSTPEGTSLQHIMRLLNFGLIYSFDECVRIGTNAGYAFELIRKAITDLKSVFFETVNESKETCLHFNFFDCVKKLTQAKVRNLRLEEQFYLLKTEIFDVVDQFGKCGAQITGSASQ